MLGKLKFKLLGWLLADICRRSGDDDGCGNCYLRLDEGEYGRCGMTDVYRQAVRAWNLKDYYECCDVEE